MTEMRVSEEAASRVAVAPDAAIYCAVDDYTDPWKRSDTVLMLHGIGEHGGMWRPWVPQLARHHRVLRPDLRGFGRSPPIPSGFTLADWADDLERLVATAGGDRVHLVGTKFGALIAFELAQRQRPWIASLSLPGMLPSPSGSLGPWLDEWLELIEGGKLETWARLTMPGRLGSSRPPEEMEWWIRLMAAAPPASVAACLRLVRGIAEPPHPERVTCPTLFLMAEAEGEADAYDQRPASTDMRRLQSRVPNARLAGVAADSYHFAATHPDTCAHLVAAFIAEVG